MKKGPASLSGFCERILDGIQNAQEDCRSQCDYDVSEAPEYYLTTKIGESLNKINIYIKYEFSVNKTLELLGVKKPGVIPKIIRNNGRFDFVAFTKKDKNPRFICEIKHPIGSSTKLDADLDRIIRTVDYARDSGLQCGIIAFYARKKNQKNSHVALKNLVSSITNRARSKCEENNCKVDVVSRDLVEGGDYSGAAVCIKIYKNR